LTEEEKKERIRYYADWIKSLWIGILALSGGLAGLALALDSHAKIILFVVGMIVDFLLVAWITLLHGRVERLMKALGREEL
jgi:CHASE2 domain-containing sensor protein